MLPLKDDNPLQHRPWATLALILLNLGVYLYQVFQPWPVQQVLVYDLGLVPAWLTGAAVQAPPPGFLPRPLTLFSSMFVHADFFHLFGNMLYLWIFGNNIEDVLRPARFLLFYLLGGALASLVQVASEPASPIPMVGASGAVAAVLGAYLVLYPRARVSVLVWFLFFVQIIKVPAILLLGLWFVLQVLGMSGAGVAWMAHIGGFVAGLAMIKPLLPRPRPL